MQILQIYCLDLNFIVLQNSIRNTENLSTIDVQYNNSNISLIAFQDGTNYIYKNIVNPANIDLFVYLSNTSSFDCIINLVIEQCNIISSYYSQRQYNEAIFNFSQEIALFPKIQLNLTNFNPLYSFLKPINESDRIMALSINDIKLPILYSQISSNSENLSVNIDCTNYSNLSSLAFNCQTAFNNVFNSQKTKIEVLDHQLYMIIKINNTVSYGNLMITEFKLDSLIIGLIIGISLIILFVITIIFLHVLHQKKQQKKRTDDLDNWGDSTQQADQSQIIGSYSIKLGLEKEDQENVKSKLQTIKQQTSIILKSKSKKSNQKRTLSGQNLTNTRKILTDI